MPSVRSWIEEGREQGIQEGELAVIMVQLTRIIGQIEPHLQKRLSELSTWKLEILAEALLDFSQREDLLVWLNNWEQQGINAD